MLLLLSYYQAHIDQVTWWTFLLGGAVAVIHRKTTPSSHLVGLSALMIFICLESVETSL